MTRPVRVLFIAGFERSGSTILQNLVATHPRVLPVGEVHHIWDRGIEEDVDCGCGKTVRTCTFWQDFFQTWLGRPEPGEILRRERAAWEIRRARKRLFIQSFGASPSRLKATMRPYLKALVRMYSSFYRMHPQIEWIVDSSKTPVYGWILSLLDDVEVRFLHIVRHPLDTEASVWKRKLRGHPWYRKVWPGEAAMRWAVWTWLHHHKLRRLPSYRMLAYDHLLERPRDVVAWVHQWLGLAPYLEAFRSDRIVWIEPAHTFGGSPSRRRTGEILIQPSPNPPLSCLHRVWAALLALPGYPLYRRARRAGLEGWASTIP